MIGDAVKAAVVLFLCVIAQSSVLAAANVLWELLALRAARP